jgi:hypothetical protein
VDAGVQKEWLILLYQNADDAVLERDIFIDITEAERIGSTADVHIVAQLDRFAGQGGFTGDGNWTSTRRFYITRDNDLNRINSPMLEDIGEVNMADPRTLTDFIVWGVRNFPARKVVLIMSDHGIGWPGGWSDPAGPSAPLPNVPLSRALGNKLYLNEIDDALENARRQSGIEKFELVGMDACLMGHIEVFSMLSRHARYSVASQEVEPALGWAYTSFLDQLVRNPSMNGGDLGRAIVDSYIVGDQRVTDAGARADFLRQNTPTGGLFQMLGGGSAAPQMSAQQLAEQLARNITLVTVDLQQMPVLIDSLNAFVFALQDESQQTVAKARSYSQSFTNVFGRNTPPSYIDLGHFVQLLSRETRNQNTIATGRTLLQAIDSAVVANKVGPQKPAATGISIYFPNSQLYSNPATGPQSYDVVAGHFAQTSLWNNFLAFHYTSRRFQPAAATAPANTATRSEPIVAPGRGEITVGPIGLSANAVNIRQQVALSSQITGSNIGYVYLFVGFYDRNANAIFVADQDYIASQETREVAGVYYPVWPDGNFTLNFDWEPLFYALNDGVTSVTVRLKPEVYGASADLATYSVDGIYTTAADGEQRYARLFFDNDGYLRQTFVFTGQDGVGAPWEITPEVGDTITILDEWLDLDSSGRVTERTSQPGGTLTFSTRPIIWEELDAPAGQYVIGYVVTDLDGNQQQSYTTITVR